MSPKCLELWVSAGFKHSIWRKCSHWHHFSLATGSTSLSWRDIVLLDLQSIREQAGRSGRVFHLQALWRNCAPFLSHHQPNKHGYWTKHDLTWLKGDRWFSYKKKSASSAKWYKVQLSILAINILPGKGVNIWSGEKKKKILLWD